MEKFLTVIVPVYNGEAWLRPCLESLIHQTDRDFQILGVNDGSRDRTARILEDYVRAWPDRITCLHQENRGLGAARNLGLRHTATPYVTFLDGDDWLDLRFVERVREELEACPEPADVLFTLPWIYDGVTHQVLPWKDKERMEAIFFPDGVSRTVNPADCPEIYGLEPSVNRRVLRRALLEKMQFAFPEGTRWEDVEPHFSILHRAKRCVGILDTGFFYRVNTQGQITAGRGRERLEMVPVFERVFEQARLEHWTEPEIAWAVRMLWSFTRWSIAMVDTQWSPALLKELHRFYRELPALWLRDYLRLCPLSEGQDMVAMALLRSPFYRSLGDYRLRREGQRLAARFRR